MGSRRLPHIGTHLGVLNRDEILSTGRNSGVARKAKGGAPGDSWAINPEDLKFQIEIEIIINLQATDRN